jgi:hypothetical protein
MMHNCTTHGKNGPEEAGGLRRGFVVKKRHADEQIYGREIMGRTMCIRASFVHSFRDMLRKIEECAERIGQILGKSGEINLLLLSEQLEERSVIAYQALGWLAREGKVSYRQRGNQVYVSLRDKEQGSA